jgi:hypothetical protein
MLLWGYVKSQVSGFKNAGTAHIHLRWTTSDNPVRQTCSGKFETKYNFFFKNVSSWEVDVLIFKINFVNKIRIYVVTQMVPLF